MDYEPFRVSYTAGQPYVGATLAMYPAPGALATAGGVVFYGTLEGYLKAVDAKTGEELYKFKTPSGIIGNVMTYTHKGKQYVGIWSLAPLVRWALFIPIGSNLPVRKDDKRPKKASRMEENPQ